MNSRLRLSRYIDELYGELFTARAGELKVDRASYIITRIYHSNPR